MRGSQARLRDIIAESELMQLHARILGHLSDGRLHAELHIAYEPGAKKLQESGGAITVISDKTKATQMAYTVAMRSRVQRKGVDVRKPRQSGVLRNL